MKKLLCFIACAAILLSASLAYGAYASTDLHDTKYTIVNTAATAKTTVIPSSLIGGDSQYELLKVDIGTAISGAAGTTGEAVVGIYDATGMLGANNAALECEIESTDNDTLSKTWIRPLKIYNGVVIVQGAYSVATIEYQKRW